MKKILSAIVMTALMGLGLVAVSSEPASAACPYTACVNTTTTVRAPAHKRAPRSVPIRVQVAAPGNVVPQGTVTVIVTKVSNGRVKYNSTLVYSGGSLQFTTQSLKRRQLRRHRHVHRQPELGVQQLVRLDLLRHEEEEAPQLSSGARLID